MITYIFAQFLPFIYDLKLFNKHKNFIRFFIFLFFVLFIGFRHNVGGDWYLYVEAAKKGTIYKSIDDTVITIIYFLSYKLFNTGIYGVNIITSLILVVSINKFLSIFNFKFFSLSMFMFFPVLIIIGAMGFVGQTIAFSFGLIAISNLIQKKFFKFYFFCIIATLSHISGFFFLLFTICIFKQKISLIFSLFCVFIIGLIYYFYNINELNRVFYFYLGDGLALNSKGAIPRIFLTSIFAFIFLIFLRKKIDNYLEKNIFILMSLISLISIPSVFFASTFVDRITFYIIPLQVYTAIMFINYLNKIYLKKIFFILIINIYFLFMITWFIFGAHSIHWLPYRFFPNNYCLLDNSDNDFCEYFELKTF